MSEMSSMGLALRDIAGSEGGVCDEPVEVQLRAQDLVTMTLRDPSTGRDQGITAPALITFRSECFQQVGGHDTWKFKVRGDVTPSGDTLWAWVYLSGKDILTVRVASKLV